ncbi:MAG: HAD family hydrolase [Dehalococcoidia bacterium]
MTAILWDFDDTLVATLPARMKALRAAYERTVGGWVDPEELWRSHKGASLEAMGERLLGADGPRFVEIYREFYYGSDRALKPFDGITSVLRAAHAASIPMGVVTSKVSWGATEELEATDLLGFFATVVGADDTDAHKPDPAPIYLALDRMLIDDPGRVVFIGDSPADMLAARNAGCIGVGATWGTLDEGLLLDAGPRHLARSPQQLLPILREHFGEVLA